MCGTTSVDRRICNSIVPDGATLSGLQGVCRLDKLQQRFTMLVAILLRRDVLLLNAE